MEITPSSQPNGQTPKLSPVETLARPIFPNPIVQSLSEIIDKSRRLKGWTVFDADSQDQAIRDWLEILNAARINGRHYPELYLRCVAVRSDFLQVGKTPPDVSAELMVAQWSGLRADLEKQRQHEQQQNAPVDKRYLIDDGKIKCHFCLGTGFRQVTRGNYKGAIPCQHESEGYQFDDGDEIVGGEEGIRIIESYLARRGVAFHAGIKKSFTARLGKREIKMPNKKETLSERNKSDKMRQLTIERNKARRIDVPTEEFIRLYKEGRSMSWIGNRFNVSEKVVRTRLKEADIKARHSADHIYKKVL